MPIRLFNTLTKTKDDFVPLDPANVRMYVCGPTVYDFAHIGNARPAIVFDVLYRLLQHEYGADHVTYVRNITDVDDKINARALRDFPDLPLNQAIRNVTEKTEAQYHADVDALGCLRPTHEPRATEFIQPRGDGKPDMVTLIAQLIARGHAYEANGEVLFDIQSMPDYGALSRRRLDEQEAGARVAVDAHKKNPGDFVLWKQSSADEPGWESPWGRGRPGWHIECSAMSAAYLGNVFDIHGGGLDLIFPHHENEIAQSRCAHGTPVMANVWMHNGFLQVEGEKMSKSLGNFFTIRELLDQWPGTALRMAMLVTHYRQPIDWTEKRLAEVHEELLSWVQLSIENEERVAAIRYRQSQGDGLNVSQELLSALSDDLNTPEALVVLRELFGQAARGNDFEAFYESAMFLGIVDPAVSGAYWTGVSSVTGPKKGAEWLFARYDLVQSLKLALINRDAEKVERLTAEIRSTGADVDISDGDKHIILQDELTEKAITEIDGKISARNAARKAKNFAESDRIRDELLAQGIVLKDSPQGTTWEVKK